MGRAILSKSLTQFSIDGQGCVPSPSFGLWPKYGRGNGHLFQKDLWQPAAATETVVLSTPDPMADHCGPTPPRETPGHSQASLARQPIPHCQIFQSFHF